MTGALWSILESEHKVCFLTAIGINVGDPHLKPGKAARPLAHFKQIIFNKERMFYSLCAVSYPPKHKLYLLIQWTMHCTQPEY